MTELTDYLTDRYQVLDTFSENERARVELVRDKNTGLVAVKKTVHRADTVYPQLRDRHFAGTPMVYDLYQCAGETVVLEEYVPGETMARCAEGRRRLGVAQVGRWLCALCDILEPPAPGGSGAPRHQAAKRAGAAGWATLPHRL